MVVRLKKQVIALILAMSLALNCMFIYLSVRERSMEHRDQITLYNTSLAQAHQFVMALEQASQTSAWDSQYKALLRGNDRLSQSLLNWGLLSREYSRYGRVNWPFQSKLLEANLALSELLISSVGQEISPTAIEKIASGVRDMVREMPVGVKEHRELTTLLTKTK